MKKIILIGVIVLAVLGLGIWLSQISKQTPAGPLPDAQAKTDGDFSSIPQEDQLRANMKSAGLDELSSEGTALHIHQHLDLVINAKNIPVPAEIGIGGNFISPLHTHDTTGVIHVESPVIKDFKLGQFFTEWGLQFTDS